MFWILEYAEHTLQKQKVLSENEITEHFEKNRFSFG